MVGFIWFVLQISQLSELSLKIHCGGGGYFPTVMYGNDGGETPLGERGDFYIMQLFKELVNIKSGLSNQILGWGGGTETWGGRGIWTWFMTFSREPKIDKIHHFKTLFSSLDLWFSLIYAFWSFELIIFFENQII